MYLLYCTFIILLEQIHSTYLFLKDAVEEYAMLPRQQPQTSCDYHMSSLHPFPLSLILSLVLYSNMQYRFVVACTI